MSLKENLWFKIFSSKFARLKQTWNVKNPSKILIKKNLTSRTCPDWTTHPFETPRIARVWVASRARLSTHPWRTARVGTGPRVRASGTSWSSGGQSSQRRDGSDRSPGPENRRSCRAGPRPSGTSVSCPPANVTIKSSLSDGFRGVVWVYLRLSGHRIPWGGSSCACSGRWEISREIALACGHHAWISEKKYQTNVLLIFL